MAHTDLYPPRLDQVAKDEAHRRPARAAVRRVHADWPHWIPYAAGAWAALIAVLSTLWLSGLGEYPLPTDPEDSASVLLGLDPRLGAWLLLGSSMTALLLVAAASRRIGLDRGNRLGVAALALIAVPYLILIPDNSLLVLLGYSPIFLVGLPFGWPPVSYADQFTWPVIFQAISLVGGLLLVLTALVWRRRARRGCLRCGRCAVRARWTSPHLAAVWGRWATLSATAVPLLYAIDRIAWALGIPLGISKDFLDDLQRSGMVWAGLGLGLFALLGAALTLGLIQRWGAVFPRWMVGLAGRRVPPMLAVIPSAAVALLVLAAAVPIVGAAVQISGGEPLGIVQILIMGSFPIWALALGTATLAYHLRRRGACASCHRDG